MTMPAEKCAVGSDRRRPSRDDAGGNASVAGRIPWTRAFDPSPIPACRGRSGLSAADLPPEEADEGRPRTWIVG